MATAKTATKAKDKKAAPAPKKAAAKVAPKKAATPPKKAAAKESDKPLGKIAQIIALHKKGYTNAEIVAEGFNKTTVSIQVSKYKKGS